MSLHTRWDSTLSLEPILDIRGFVNRKEDYQEWVSIAPEGFATILREDMGSPIPHMFLETYSSDGRLLDVEAPLSIGPLTLIGGNGKGSVTYVHSRQPGLLVGEASVFQARGGRVAPARRVVEENALSMYRAACGRFGCTDVPTYVEEALRLLKAVVSAV